MGKFKTCRNIYVNSNGNNGIVRGTNERKSVHVSVGLIFTKQYFDDKFVIFSQYYHDFY